MNKWLKKTGCWSHRSESSQIKHGTLAATHYTLYMSSVYVHCSLHGVGLRWLYTGGSMVRFPEDILASCHISERENKKYSKQSVRKLDSKAQF